MATVLVTGGLGFIGSHIADACAERGDKTVSVDDLSTGREEHGNPRVINHRVDITDISALEPVFAALKPDIVFHTAALARIQPSFDRPGRFFDVNALGTRHMLTLAKRYGVKRVVYSASSSAYGEQERMPLAETMSVSSQALNPYASTKRMGEMLMRDMGKATGGSETVCLRYFNVYGPRQSTTADGPYATVVGIFLDQARQGKPLTVVPDGHQRRDFTHVSDVARANLLAASSAKVGDAEIINIGASDNRSVWEVAALALGLPSDTPDEELARSGACVLLPPRRGEMRETLADISRARELLGWEPGISFEEGIARLRTAA